MTSDSPPPGRLYFLLIVGLLAILGSLVFSKNDISDVIQAIGSYLAFAISVAIYTLTQQAEARAQAADRRSEGSDKRLEEQLELNRRQNEILVRQSNLEYVPNLMLDMIMYGDIFSSTISIRLINMGKYNIILKEAFFIDHVRQVTVMSEDRGKSPFILPGNGINLETDYIERIREDNAVRGGVLVVRFLYGSTGSKMHEDRWGLSFAGNAGGTVEDLREGASGEQIHSRV